VPEARQGDNAVTAYAMAMAKKPQVVGIAKLAKEAMGIRKMSKNALRSWRLESILPKEVDENRQ